MKSYADRVLGLLLQLGLAGLVAGTTVLFTVLASSIGMPSLLGPAVSPLSPGGPGNSLVLPDVFGAAEPAPAGEEGAGPAIATTPPVPSTEVAAAPPVSSTDEVLAPSQTDGAPDGDEPGLGVDPDDLLGRASQNPSLAPGRGSARLPARPAPGKDKAKPAGKGHKPDKAAPAGKPSGPAKAKGKPSGPAKAKGKPSGPTKAKTKKKSPGQSTPTEKSKPSGKKKGNGKAKGGGGKSKAPTDGAGKQGGSPKAGGSSEKGKSFR